DVIGATLAAVVIGGADDARIGKERRVLGGDVGIEDPLVRVHEILGGYRLAVAPLRALLEVEGVGPAVLRDVVAARGGRHRLEVLVERQQRFEDLANDGALSGEAAAIRIQVVGFALESIDRDLLRTARLSRHLCGRFGGGGGRRGRCRLRGCPGGRGGGARGRRGCSGWRGCHRDVAWRRAAARCLARRPARARGERNTRKDRQNGCSHGHTTPWLERTHSGGDPFKNCAGPAYGI